MNPFYILQNVRSTELGRLASAVANVIEPSSPSIIMKLLMRKSSKSKGPVSLTGCSIATREGISIRGVPIQLPDMTAYDKMNEEIEKAYSSGLSLSSIRREVRFGCSVSLGTRLGNLPISCETTVVIIDVTEQISHFSDTVLQAPCVQKKYYDKSYVCISCYAFHLVERGYSLLRYQESLFHILWHHLTLEDGDLREDRKDQ